ncbi:zinc finger protein Gfi-1 isoform X18 [Aplysia californica]|uniref:Zinc finger protein Gfi-1 isoform X18 n=1 Tax=Aplysia californica TaxID=6500 RepID=A0ABM0JB22_APLCA|nr:zinc finger protein Gfi-1 isoform X18 [Aplysia californica]
MDFDSSSKFISSLAKFLQSLCNGYVEFDNGVEVIGHIYLNVDTGKKIDYILNEKVCKTDENSVTFISNSFHAQPAEKPKPAPKNLKSTDQDKPSDPGGLPGDDDEIMILDDAEARNVALELREGPASSPHSKTVRPPNASKRSYSQSFASQKHLAKHSRADPSSTQSPNGAHHDSDSIHSERSNSSTNFISSQLPQESLTSESDPSQLPSVFPHTFGDSSNNQGSTGKDIKQEPSNDMNLLHVKQEYDPSGQEEEHEAYGDSQDQSLYSGLYDEQYYPGARRGQSQRVDFNQSGSVDQGELFPGAAGTSGDVGDASGPVHLSRESLSTSATGSQRPVSGLYMCEFCQKVFSTLNHYEGHKNANHLKLKPFKCDFCDKAFAHKNSLTFHRKGCAYKL